VGERGKKGSGSHLVFVDGELDDGREGGVEARDDLLAACVCPRGGGGGETEERCAGGGSEGSTGEGLVTGPYRPVSRAPPR